MHGGRVMRCGQGAALLMTVGSLLGGPARAAEGEAQGPRYRIWVEPLWATMFAIGIPSTVDGNFGYLPVGLDLPLGSRKSLGLELTWFSRGPSGCVRGGEPSFSLRGLRFSAGPVFQLSGARPMEGAFVKPLATVTVAKGGPFRNRPDCSWTDGNEDEIGTAIEAGIDLGYTWRWETFTLSMLLGVGIGAGFNAPTMSSGWVATWAAGSEFDRAPVQPVWNFNLDLVRLGWAF